MSKRSTVTVQWEMPREVEQALERLAQTGFYGSSPSDVVVTLLSRELERIAEKDLVNKLRGLAG
jgi:Arc/MetJ-type ribon-helix-helix transcriptional regulator